MIRIAKWMARAAFGIGVSVGILLAGAIQPAAVACMLPNPPCSDFGNQDQSNQDYLNLQCAVHNALYNDGSAPGAVYRFDNDAPQPGKYAGKCWDGRPVTLEAIVVVDLQMKTNQLAIYNMGVTASFVVGRLTGSAGNVPITCLFIHPNGTMGCTSAYVLQPISILSDTNYDSYSQAARTQAGVRVLDVNTFQSFPLKKVTGFGAASTSSSDTATVFGTNVNGPMSDEQRADCVKLKYAHFDIDMKAARLTLGVCMAAAVAAFVVAMAICAVAGLDTGPLAPIVVVACCLGALALELLAFAGCAAVYAIMVNAAMRHLNLELQECGITVA